MSVYNIIDVHKNETLLVWYMIWALSDTETLPQTDNILLFLLKQLFFPSSHLHLSCLLWNVVFLSNKDSYTCGYFVIYMQFYHPLF